jgi:GH24 family phage-related lysozyme (muramidase)
MAENNTLDFEHPGPVEKAVLGIAMRHEGFRAKPYHVKGQKQRLIGFGHEVKGKQGGQPMTFGEAAGQAVKDLDKAGNKVWGFINSGINLAKHQLAALAELAMNIGANKLKGSKLINDINKGDMATAEQDFHDYTHAKIHGKMKVLKGLEKRRDADANLFAGHIPEAGPMTYAEMEGSRSKHAPAMSAINRHTHNYGNASFAHRHVGHRSNYAAMKGYHGHYKHLADASERHGQGHYRHFHYHRHLSDRTRGHHHQPT